MHVARRSMVPPLLALVLLGCSDAAPEVAATSGAGGAAAGEEAGPDQAALVAHVTALASPDLAGRVPGTDGGAKAVEYVRAGFEAIGLGKALPEGDESDGYLQVFDHEGARIANVVGVVEGGDPAKKGEVVLVTAHLDHVGDTEDCDQSTTPGTCLGADDDASGTAVMMELARLLVQSRVEVARTIVFVAFNAEETGMFGSQHYEANPVVPNDSVKLVLDLDMVGKGDGSGISIMGTLKDDGTEDPATHWIKPLIESRAPYRVDADKPEPSSDCATFAPKGIPCVFVWSLPETAHSTYHQPTDTAASIDPAALVTTTKQIWAALRPLATGAPIP